MALKLLLSIAAVTAVATDAPVDATDTLELASPELASPDAEERGLRAKRSRMSERYSARSRGGRAPGGDEGSERSRGGRAPGGDEGTDLDHKEDLDLLDHLDILDHLDHLDHLDQKDQKDHKDHKDHLDHDHWDRKEDLDHWDRKEDLDHWDRKEDLDHLDYKEDLDHLDHKDHLDHLAGGDYSEATLRGTTALRTRAEPALTSRRLAGAACVATRGTPSYCGKHYGYDYSWCYTNYWGKWKKCDGYCRSNDDCEASSPCCSYHGYCGLSKEHCVTQSR